MRGVIIIITIIILIIIIIIIMTTIFIYTGDIYQPYTTLVLTRCPVIKIYNDVILAYGFQRR